LTETVAQQLLQHIKMLLKRHMASERNFRRIILSKYTAVTKRKVSIQITLTRNQYSQRCYASNYYILGCRMYVSLCMCAVSKRANVKRTVMIPSHQANGKITLGAGACSYIQDTQSANTAMKAYVSMGLR